MSKGDILFYRATTGNMVDTAIVWNNKLRGMKTDIVHTAIDIGDNKTIAAGTNGVTEQTYNEHDKFVRWQCSDTLSNVDNVINDWLLKCIGLSYGWGDIVQAALIGIPPFIDIDAQHYDCSALAAMFLFHCMYQPLIDAKVDTNSLTPAMLAKLLVLF